MIHLIPISRHHVATLKETRLRALRDAPSAFGSTYEREVQLSDGEWRERALHWEGARTAAYLAVEDEKPCGLIGTFLHKDDDARAGIVSMWVAPEKRRQRVGHMLIEAAIAWAKEKNARAIYLMVTSNNEAAIAFYKSLGFAETGHSEPYPNDPALVEYEMALTLLC